MIRLWFDGKIVRKDLTRHKEELEEILQISLEMRRRVKEQLKKLVGMEFYDVNLSMTIKKQVTNVLDRVMMIAGISYLIFLMADRPVF